MDVETIAHRVAENQDAFRRANEQIEEAADKIGADLGLLPFLCECPAVECVEIVQLTREEYETVRGQGNTFLVASGHEVTELEGVSVARVDQRLDRFSLMEKIDEAGDRAIELDPRANYDDG